MVQTCMHTIIFPPQLHTYSQEPISTAKWCCFMALMGSWYSLHASLTTRCFFTWTHKGGFWACNSLSSGCRKPFVVPNFQIITCITTCSSNVLTSTSRLTRIMLIGPDQIVSWIRWASHLCRKKVGGSYITSSLKAHVHGMVQKWWRVVLHSFQSLWNKVSTPWKV